MPELVCEVCGKEFYSQWLSKTCSKECAKERKRLRNIKYAEEHREQIQAYHKNYYQTVIKPVQKQLYELHKEALQERYEKHKSERNARRRARYAGNGERVRQQNAAWREKNRELKRKIDARYREKFRDKINEQARIRRRMTGLDIVEIMMGEIKLILYKCDRLGLKARHLPCGDRWQCWDNEPCKRIPRGKTPLEYGEDRGTMSWFEKSKIKPVFEED